MNSSILSLFLLAFLLVSFCLASYNKLLRNNLARYISLITCIILMLFDAFVFEQSISNTLNSSIIAFLEKYSFFGDSFLLREGAIMTLFYFAVYIVLIVFFNIIFHFTWVGINPDIKWSPSNKALYFTNIFFAIIAAFTISTYLGFHSKSIFNFEYGFLEDMFVKLEEVLGWNL